MSRKNYSKMSTRPKTNDFEEVTEAVELDEVVDEPVVEDTVVDEAVQITGVVTNCKQLNVRKQAIVTSQILVVIKEGTVVNIDEDRSTNDFYAIELPSNNIAGYCMKKYIKIID